MSASTTITPLPVFQPINKNLKNARCSFDGCNKFQWSRGYCAAHYTSLKKKGILAPVKFTGSIAERFERNYVVNTKTGCWEWTGFTIKGYAIIWDNVKSTIRASRFAYENYVGPIPDGYQALHKCDNPLCVNWKDHIFVGTAKENMADCHKKRRAASQKGTNKPKLTDRMTVNIRIMYARGESIETLSEIYLMKYESIRRVVKGLSHQKSL